MGAGYGNHDASGPADAKPDAAGQKPPAGGQDRPGMDLGGSQDKSGTGAMAGSHSTPPSEGQGPQSGRNEAGAPSLSERRDISTPGAGSLPDDPQGDETDPATD